MSDITSLRGVDAGLMQNVTGYNPADDKELQETQRKHLDFQNDKVAEKVLSTDQPVRAEDLSPALMDELANRVNDVLNAMGTQLRFERDNREEPMMIKVLDYEGNVLRTIPPQEMVSAARKLREFQKTIGLVVDEKR